MSTRANGDEVSNLRERLALAAQVARSYAPPDARTKSIPTGAPKSDALHNRSRVPPGVFDRLSCNEIIRLAVSDRAFDQMSDLWWRDQCRRRGFDMDPPYPYRTHFLRECGGDAYARETDRRLTRSIMKRPGCGRSKSSCRWVVRHAQLWWEFDL